MSTLTTLHTTPDELFNASGLTLEQCQRARLSRDRRFDGHFFIGVKTTGIFCRPICPVNLPLEKNVEYLMSQAQALQAGYRPCLRCRPDSAPGSCAWRGVETTFQRAVTLIDEGALQQNTLPVLAERLGISDRYLRQLFQKYLGMSPKQYAQCQQLMFAKQLLHSSNMGVADIAIASGFNSVRRFNDACAKKLKLTPRDIRKTSQPQVRAASSPVVLRISYRPPFNWDYLLAFYRRRAIRGVEYVDEISYSRTFRQGEARGWFRAELADKDTLSLTVDIDDFRELKAMVVTVRRMFDADAEITVIEEHLKQTEVATLMGSGVRIPGVWSTWEAGLRAIFGQQVSLTGAITVLNQFVGTLHRDTVSPASALSELTYFFPTPADILSADLSTLKMPQSRKDTVKRFAEYMLENSESDPELWLPLKGIGPWTVNYAKLRGQSLPDCFLSTDLVIKKVVAALYQERLVATDASTSKQQGIQVSPNESPKSSMSDLTQAVSPWGSYATFNCWNSMPGTTRVTRALWAK